MKCKYCSNEIEKGINRCLHCGTLNPSLDKKGAMYWTVGLMFVFFVVTYIIDKIG